MQEPCYLAAVYTQLSCVATGNAEVKGTEANCVKMRHAAHCFLALAGQVGLGLIGTSLM